MSLSYHLLLNIPIGMLMSAAAFATYTTSVLGVKMTTASIRN